MMSTASNLPALSLPKRRNASTTLCLWLLVVSVWCICDSKALFAQAVQEEEPQVQLVDAAPTTTEGYEGVVVDFVPGKPAIMELFQAVDESSTDPVDNVTGKRLVERIELFKYADTKSDLHQLFQDKGLVQKPVEERDSIMQKRKEARDEEERLRQERRDRIAQDRLQRTKERHLKGEGMPAEQRRDKLKQRWKESSQRKLKLADTGVHEDVNDEL